ncbi:MAG: exodeoxyribonuclease VII large subunit [Prevotellaceae bacterium]|jgi:exodeoxyribonuclease VII large subunit|nr:exodeoxyribonuclease VII large subunit [Prevotellaceae bacterium]
MESLSLLELNLHIKRTLKTTFTTPVWVHAELSEVRENAAGHCYLELIETEPNTNAIMAKQKATIWDSRYRMIKPCFEEATGISLQAGIKILAFCKVEMHELYGISLQIFDIDPTFTVGDMAMRRTQIIRRLTDEGVANVNKSLPMPHLPQRIAVISSETAAGYGDFMHQLTGNAFGYWFSVELFAAVMQGGQTESSIIAALDAIYARQDEFDVVVIIRGGGSTSELSAFDNYNLAFHCAQFPLPLISGIGHLRDDTIVDLVAHSCVKTPTAAAERLITIIRAADTHVEALVETLADTARQQLAAADTRCRYILQRLPYSANTIIRECEMYLQAAVEKLRGTVRQYINEEQQRILLIQKTLDFSDPQKMLLRGYALVERRGTAIRSINQVDNGDTLAIYLADGCLQTTVVSKKRNATNNPA